MNAPEADLSGPSAASAAPAGAVVRQPLGKVMTTLMRREFWEHRSLWISPLVVAGLLVLTALPIHMGNFQLGEGSPDFHQMPNRIGAFTLLIWGQTVPQYLVMSIVVPFYLLDCLYQERKDRSILFWKSLPVSDATTVIAKLLVGLVIVPLGVYLLAMVAGVLFQGVWAIRVSSGALPDIAAAWNTVAWLKVQALMLYGLIVSMLWYAPLAASLLLVSAWARKNTFLWSSLPLVIAILIEKIGFGTRYVVDLLNYRTLGIWNVLGIDPRAPDDINTRVVSLADLFDNIAMGRPFLNIDLWLGLAVAAALVFAAIRIRRYRDDT